MPSEEIHLEINLPIKDWVAIKKILNDDAPDYLLENFSQVFATKINKLIAAVEESKNQAERCKKDFEQRLIDLRKYDILNSIVLPEEVGNETTTI